VRRTDQVTAVLVFIGAVAYGATAALKYRYTSAEGPGSGFLPFWLGVMMAMLAVLLFVRATRGPAGTWWLPSGHGLARLASVLVATILFVALLHTIGMITGIALFLVGILRFVEGYRWWPALAIAGGTAAGCWLLFARWLGVPFPTNALGF
jgi:hypothetical protein